MYNILYVDDERSNLRVFTHTYSDEFKIFTSLNISRFIIAGEFDRSVNLNYLQVVKNECNGKCELIVLNECGHFPSLEKPDEFSQTLKEIVEQVF